jgi:hypothetical protein
MMHNMCCAKMDPAAAIDATRVGVLGWLDEQGGPRSCAVTPYRIGDDVVVTSTLALLGKVRALRLDPRAAVLAGEHLVRGRASLALDTTAGSFDELIRDQERAKYPPARTLLGLPGHRRLLWWYVGRAFIRLPLAGATSRRGDDQVTVTVVDGDGPAIIPVLGAAGLEDATAGTRVWLGDDVPDGRACVLLHDELDDFAELLQLKLTGTVTDGTLTVARRTGTLEPSGAGTADQLRQLLALGRSARRSRARIAHLATDLRGDQT